MRSLHRTASRRRFSNSSQIVPLPMEKQLQRKRHADNGREGGNATKDTLSRCSLLLQIERTVRSETRSYLFPTFAFGYSPTECGLEAFFVNIEPTARTRLASQCGL